jgi:hypothetical protein
MEVRKIKTHNYSRVLMLCDGSAVVMVVVMESLAGGSLMARALIVLKQCEVDRLGD